MNNPENNSYNAFQKWGIITVVFVYLLILVGGIVRSTGSGMGCPDWPKCFGSWVPPTHVSQLPADYREVYAQKRKTKNEKLAVYLEKLGFKDLAYTLTHDSSIYEEAAFNPVRTWIEYLNRLVGVLIGVFIFLTVLFSFRYFRTDRTIFLLCLSAFVGVLLEGWIGSIVVSTNLLPGIITLHMMLAIGIVWLLLWAVGRSWSHTSVPEASTGNLLLTGILIISMGISLLQVVLGTQVREAIDRLVVELGEQERYRWIEEVGARFYLHRSFSWLVLGTHVWMLYLLKKQQVTSRSIRNRVFILAGLVGVEIGTGVVMGYMGIPAFLQPVHLLVATLILGVQFVLLMRFNPSVFGLSRRYMYENQSISK